MDLEVKTIFKIDFKKLNKELGTSKLQKELLKEIIKPIVDVSKKNIKSGEANLLPLKPITIQNRRNEGISHDTPLFKTGKLVKSLYANTKGIKSKVNYAKIHYDGTSNKRPPARPYIGYRSQGNFFGPHNRGNLNKLYADFNKKYIKLLKRKLRESRK